ncbi:VanZ family protein [Candidatus Pacearchaeota archaeon]|nr:VanZ family protein [Candidatus Pacearchaeota archaeon]
MLSYLEKNNQVSWFITLFIAAFIFYMSSQTFQGGGGKGYLSYIYHFFVFFTLAFFLLLSSIKGKLNKEIFFISLLLAILYGMSDEVHQAFVPGRSSDYKDVLMDSVGIMAAAVIYSFSILVRNKSLSLRL